MSRYGARTVGGRTLGCGEPGQVRADRDTAVLAAARNGCLG
ncbi:hypothetical protein ACFWNL_24005 [Kitasatospora sp. NPDC058397]